MSDFSGNREYVSSKAVDSDARPRSIDDRHQMPELSLFEVDKAKTQINSRIATLICTTFQGNLTGNVTGNLTGDVTGDLTGNHKDNKQTISSTATLDSADTGRIYVDPTAGAITLTLASPSAVTDLPIKFLVRRQGNGLIDRGDCESTTAPMVSGETTPVLTRTSWARDSAQKRAGTYSYKLTITTTGPTQGVDLQDSISTSDLHGLAAGATYTLSAWVYIPSSGGPAASEVYVLLQHYAGGVWTNVTSYATETDKWQKISVTQAFSGSATGSSLRIGIASGASLNEYIYVDDIQLYRHYDVTIAAPSGASINGRSSVHLREDGNFIELVSDGENYLILAGKTTGQNTNGNYKIDWPSGEQVCWNHATVTDQAINAAYVGGMYTGSRTITWPLAYASAPTLIPGYARWSTGFDVASAYPDAASPSTTQGVLAFGSWVSRASGTAFRYSWMAIGQAS